jgi:hypothetical protein
MLQHPAENVGAQLVARNARGGFNLKNLVGRNPRASAPVGDDTGVVDAEGCGRLGEAAQLFDDTFNGGFDFKHVETYHAA